MEDFQFQRRRPAAAQPGKVAAGGRAKPAARYDDVFGGPPRSSQVPARPEDYREIFGAAAACSIPVLDLPPPPEDGYELHQCSALDYLDIFGGGDFAATYHELFASQVSNGIGVPLPSELGSTASVIGTSNSRESKGMGHEKQEMPVSGNIAEGLSRDQSRCSLNGVTLHLNDGTNLLNSPTHMASWSSKSEAVNMTIHKNQAQMVPGFAYIVKDPEFDKPNSEVDINTSFDSNSSKETSEPHLKKAELSGDLKYSVSTMKGDQRSTQLELSGSMIASTYKDNTSFSSKNQPAIPISNGFSAKTSNYQSPHENLVKKKAEGKWQSKTVTNCADTGCQSDLKVTLVASEDVCPNEEHLSCSFKDHSASCKVKLSPDCSIYDFTGDGGNTRVAEANHFQKSMPEFPPCIISQSSEDNTTEQKMSNSIRDPQKDVSVNECVHSRSSSCQSISSLDRSCLDSTFLKVSDINLRTQPSQGPPPARPPPGRPPSKFGNSGRNLRRTLTDYQKRDIETATTYKSHSFKQSVRVGQSPFDLEADVSSAAAASVAAIKEAMELAQAKLNSAKVSRERKKGNLQSCRKIGLNEDLRNTTKDEHQTVQDNQGIKEDMVVQLACGNTDGQDNVFAAQKKMTAFTPPLLTGDFKEKEINTRSAEAELSLQAKHWGEPEVSSASNIKEDRVGEWKIAEQFYEFIQSEKKLSKVPDNSLKGDTEKRSNAKVDIIEEEQNASELKRREILLEPPKFVVWEGDSDRWENPCSQEPSLEFDMPWNCSLRQTETVNAHCQEKQPGEIQELLNTEQKTEWRASEEGFICELSKKNPRVNKDAFKCKPSYGCQSPEKVQNGADETFGCEETEKDINVTDDYFKDLGEENIVLSKLSKSDGNKTEANVMYVSNVSGKDVHLKAACMNHEYGFFTESWNVEPKVASLLFGQDNGKTSKLPHQAYEWAKNENELKVPLDIPDVKCKDGTAGAHEDFKEKVRENMQAVQVIDSNEVLKSAQDGWKGTGNVKKIDDAQKARSLGGQQYILKVLPEFPGNEDAGAPVENAAHGHETRDGKGDKRENAEMSDFDKVREMRRIEVEEKMLEVAKERERRKLKEEKERDKKLEEEKKRERIRLEEEREREGKKLEEERKLKRLEEEKAKKKLAEEREKSLEEERETKRLEEERKKRRLEEIEKKRLEEERERKRLEDEERENKRLEKEMEENERKRLEDEERENKRLEKEMEEKRLEEENERKRLEDEEREKKRLEEERKKKWLEEERKKKKLEDEEREKKRLEEEKERKRLENEQRENNKLEEEEGKKLGDEGREKKRLQEENKGEKSEKEDREGKKSEEAEERKNLEEERESRERVEKERIRKKQEEEDVERSKLEEKERERRKHEEERERRRLEEIERERRKLEEKVRERKRIEEEERERKLEEEKVRERQKIEEEKAREKKLEEEKGKEWRKREEEKEREREREKDRQAVERATREAHERAFAEARERAERAAVERITAEARQRALAEARERAEKTSAEALEKSTTEKVSREARLRSERAAVERATAEARERAVEKAIAEKTAQDARERAEKLVTPSREGVKQNFSNVRDCDPQFQNVGSSRSSYQKHPDSNASFTNETSGGSEGESAIRCKARMERHQRTIERAAKALAEKNLRDIIAQREQAERNRLAETLDADVKRWSNGKEGNLRALLSTLQYILGPETGWHPIPLTDVVTAPAVKKAYRKATLCVHPDKLQQRGASIHQKYICQKVFDLLKEAWNKFNSEEW